MKASLTRSFLLAAAFLLAGCSTTAPQKPQEQAAASPRQSAAAAPAERLPQASPSAKPAAPQEQFPADPLIDAPYQTLATCRAAEPLVSGERFGDTRLICRGLHVSATITEFRDAGWRIEELRMTESKTPDGVVALPFSVTLRKLF